MGRTRLVASTCLALLAGAFLGTAGAVPTTMSFTGRLSDDSGPLNGDVELVIKICDTADVGTGSCDWSETLATTADGGLVYVELGNTNPLNEAVFTGASLWFDITVNGTQQSPRLAISAVPYATRSAVADSADLLGTLAPSDVQERVTGTCAVGSSIRVVNLNGSVECEADDDSDTTYSAGAGIALSGTTISLNTAGCTANEVLKYNGSGGWNCVADLDTNTTYSAGPGLSLSGTTFSLSTAGCTAGEVLKYNGSGGWNCVADLDTNTTYSAGAGLSLSGTTFALSTSGCVSGEVLKYNGTGAWNCLPETVQTLTCETNQSTAVLVPAGELVSHVSPTCSSGYTLTGGGCWALSGSLNIYIDRPHSSNNAWQCYFLNQGATNVSAYVYGRCCRI